MATPAWDVLVATCPSRTSLAKIANKWTAMIVIALSDGPLRFGELRDTVQGISGKVLADTLRDLERDGIVERIAYNEMPPRVEYELTDLGRTLHEPLGALGRWAEQHIEQVLQARETFDRQLDDQVLLPAKRSRRRSQTGDR
ncbi:winged helix-turn-helix transcriptional regulator [Microlunatus parietis]|uniref:DNA-binding HxlR family transcriptional regulator n=1 Tax=Microlunatus parietis TaxID=682979 RepID=A0A7Y9ICX0_9ACTN|nr:helix-turn-helix domain-containing protein [Microlunatus parietis]NYE74410.1 DNA-binding HxlR family transcriptional regulator [Microlunatus parietis]